jgi:hypothetical protein
VWSGGLERIAEALYFVASFKVRSLTLFFPFPISETYNPIILLHKDKR